jgi:hypothetical protein
MELVPVLDPTAQEIYQHTHAPNEKIGLKRLKNLARYRLYFWGIISFIVLFILGFIGTFIYERSENAFFLLAWNWLSIPLAGCFAIAWIVLLFKDWKSALLIFHPKSILVYALLVWTVGISIFLPATGFIGHLNALGSAPVRYIDGKTAPYRIGLFDIPYCFVWEDCKKRDLKKIKN